MAYDEGLAQLLRDELTELDEIVEKRMFGGLCFMWRGNMLCGVHKDGAMFRVGKENEATALGIDGAVPMQFTGRKMGGIIDVSDDGLSCDNKREQWMGLAKQFVGGLPAK